MRVSQGNNQYGVAQLDIVRRDCRWCSVRGSDLRASPRMIWLRSCYFFLKKRKSKSRLIGQNVGLLPWFAQEASLGDDDKKIISMQVFFNKNIMQD